LSLTIESSRFGRVEIEPETVLEFPEGLIGLGGSRYALLGDDPDAPFLWLQSLEDPSLALPVTNPHRFFQGFAVEVVDEDVERLGLDGSSAMDVYVTVRAAPVLEDFTANLKAPILVRAGQA
jgi:flagellar assembly factor FliW